MDSNRAFDAVIFDLDGVVTRTASLHSAAWKRMFDDFLHGFYQATGQPFRAFDHEADYLPHVDGKPRYKGVAAFLASRGIELPIGDPADPPERETVCGLGNRKDQLFNQMIDTLGVEVFPSSIALIEQLLAQGIRVGVATSSKNCRAILDASGIAGLFETAVDGVVSAELGLQGQTRTGHLHHSGR